VKRWRSESRIKVRLKDRNLKLQSTRKKKKDGFKELGLVLTHKGWSE